VTNDERRAADLSFVAGILSAPAGVVVVGRIFSGELPPLLAHTVALLISIAASLLFSRIQPGKLSRSFRNGSALGLVLSIPMTLWAARFIAEAAHSTAAGRPYCVMVSDGVGHYRPPQGLLDFSPVRMWGTDGGRRAVQFHAVLWVVGNREPEPYNWSYFAREFRPTGSRTGLGRLRATDCLPATDSTAQLSWF
jgi:hypothetical protein